MLHLLKIEWMKVKHYRTFWVLSILYLLSVYGGNYISFLIHDSTQKKTEMASMVLGQPFSFPEVWHTVSWVSSWLMFVPGLLMIISVSNEFSFKTHRQNIIDGWSRTQFILVKIALAFIVALVSTLTVFIIALLFGIMVGNTPTDFSKLEYVGYFFIQALSYTSLALLFSIIFKRAAIAIGVFFMYTVFIENLLSGILNRYANNIGRYLPLETTDNLVPIPLTFVRQFMDSYNVTLLLIMAFVYLALYYFISIRKFQTDDL